MELNQSMLYSAIGHTNRSHICGINTINNG